MKTGTPNLSIHSTYYLTVLINHIRYTDQAYDYNKPVQVYWNFHKKCFSLRQNGLVVGYANCISLKDAQFKVSEAGRQRVLRTRRKNVHAYVQGLLRMLPTEDDYWDVKVVYDPYKDSHFSLWVDRSVKVSSAKSVLLRAKNNTSEILLSRGLQHT